MAFLILFLAEKSIFIEKYLRNRKKSSTFAGYFVRKGASIAQNDRKNNIKTITKQLCKTKD